MKKIFHGDIELNTIYEITPEMLSERGITCALCDLDNTIADYDTPLPTEQVIGWLASMKEAGVRIVIVSNNERERVEKFCETLDIPYFWKSGKPRRKAVDRALDAIGAKKSETILIGDKRTTDMACAFLSGIPSIKVKSIKPRKIIWKKK